MVELQRETVPLKIATLRCQDDATICPLEMQLVKLCRVWRRSIVLSLLEATAAASQAATSYTSSTPTSSGQVGVLLTCILYRVRHDLSHRLLPFLRISLGTSTICCLLFSVVSRYEIQPIPGAAERQLALCMYISTFYEYM